MAKARILKLKELKPGKIVWLQRSHIVEPHIVEITSVRKGENYFGQKCMEVNFSEPWSRCFTFLPPGQDYNDYKNTWICWDAKPTKQQMKIMENWDEDKEDYEC